MIACPDESEILELVEGRAEGTAIEAIQAHLDSCASCRELVANAADELLVYDASRTGRRPPSSDAERLRGSMIGRHTVLAREGAGGMGAVYSAYDPQLDRRIAVKLVRTDRLVRGDPSVMRAQVLREAQAMARLNHPNVIAVYDVGALDDELFIAMEFVEGTTLGAWARRPGRDWRQILCCYLLAGEGLAAAHRAGLVHRDFKPDNVLIGDDGRVRVGDFGLASIRASDEVSHGSPAVQGSGASTSPALGTPAYMAPEQRAGQRVDARADQFSFCRALEQALFEQGPTGAPGWLSVPLLRGQQVDRELRFASMEALLASLRRDPARTRRRVLTAAGVVGIATAAAFAGARWLPAGQPDPCAAADDGLAGVWDDPARARVGAALRESVRADAVDVAERVDVALSSYASRWTSMHTEVCEATRVRAEQSEALFDVRMQCLVRLRGTLAALTTGLVEQRPAPLDEAIQAAAALPNVEHCADTAQLLALAPLPADPETRRAIESTQARLDRLRIDQHLTGDAAALLAPTELVLGQARALAYPPLERSALELLADLQDLTGDRTAAETTLHAALQAGAAAHDDRALALDMIRLVAVVGVGQSRFAEAEITARVTEAMLVRAGSPAEDLAGLASVRGQLARAQAHPDQARVHQERAIAWLDGAPGATAIERAAERSNLGATLTDLGDIDGALAQLELARAMLEHELGPTHPVIASVLFNIGSAQVQQGALAQGTMSHRAAIEIWERAWGPEHMMVGQCLYSLAMAELRAGDRERARRDAERSIAVLERALGPAHVELAWARNNYGEILCASGEHEAGVGELERSLAIGERALGRDHPDLSYPLGSLAECHLARAQWVRAIPPLERTLAVLATGEGEATRRRREQTHALLERARLAAAGHSAG